MHRRQQGLTRPVQLLQLLLLLGYLLSYTAAAAAAANNQSSSSPDSAVSSSRAALLEVPLVATAAAGQHGPPAADHHHHGQALMECSYVLQFLPASSAYSAAAVGRVQAACEWASKAVHALAGPQHSSVKGHRPVTAAGASTTQASTTSLDSSSSSSSSSGGGGGGSHGGRRGFGAFFDPSGFDTANAMWYFGCWLAVAVLVEGGTGVFFDYLYSPWLIRNNLAVRTTDSYITRPWQEIFWINSLAILGAAVPPTLVGGLICGQAFRPVQLDYSFNIPATLWSVAVTLLVHDAYYYWLHRAMHGNKWLYRTVHATHHDPAVMLEARTGMVVTVTEAVVTGGLFYACSVFVNFVLFGSMQHNIYHINVWVVGLPAYTSGQLGNIGHSGLKYHTYLPLLALNPLLLALLFPGTAHSALDHQIHHERASYNLSLYYRHMDEWFGTAAPSAHHKRAPSSLLLMAYNLSYYAAVTWILSNLGWISGVLLSKAGLTAVCCLALLPVPSAGWSWLRGLQLWDRLRQAYGCTVTCEQQLDPAHRYIFAYHPHGLLSRGWWLVFGLKGRASPVANMRVALAMHKAVLSIPVVKHVLACIGVCNADKATLLSKLNQPKHPASIAIIPGGWAEARFARTNKLLLSKRLGFVKLAMETGAQLVPVLGIGEQRVGGAGANMFAAAALLPAKPLPLQVVFGTPMAAAPGEDAASFHQRYVTALLQLGKQHGMDLTIV